MIVYVYVTIHDRLTLPLLYRIEISTDMKQDFIWSGFVFGSDFGPIRGADFGPVRCPKSTPGG